MALGFLQILAGAFFLLTLGGIGFIIYNKIREREEPENQIIIENYLPQFADGHTDGIVSDMKFSEDKIMIEFYPRDINYIRELNKDKKFKIKPYKIYYDKRQVVPLPMFSSHRFKLKAFPHRVDLFPEGLKNTSFGQTMMYMINERNKLGDESKLLQERLKNMNEIAKQTFGGEIYTDFVIKTEEQRKQLAENIPVKREEVIEKKK